MKTNMGTIDRSLRILAAITIGVLYFDKVISGTAAVLLLVIAGIFIVTSLLGFCPLYHPFKIKTNKN